MVFRYVSPFSFCGGAERGDVDEDHADMRGFDHMTMIRPELPRSSPTQVVESDMTGPSCIVALVRFAPD